jgi:GAF domain-containing protein
MEIKEQNRLQLVDHYKKLDKKLQQELQDIVMLAADICDSPIALLTLLDEESNWLKIRVGTDVEHSPRELSFCQYAIEQDEVYMIPDTYNNGLFDGNPIVHAEPGIRFYAGSPLQTKEGFALGTLCVMDLKPKSLTEKQQKH